MPNNFRFRETAETGPATSWNVFEQITAGVPLVLLVPFCSGTVAVITDRIGVRVRIHSRIDDCRYSVHGQTHGCRTFTHGTSVPRTTNSLSAPHNSPPRVASLVCINVPVSSSGTADSGGAGSPQNAAQNSPSHPLRTPTLTCSQTSAPPDCKQSPKRTNQGTLTARAKHAQKQKISTRNEANVFMPGPPNEFGQAIRKRRRYPT